MSDVKYRISNDTVAGARKANNDMKKNASLPKMGDSPASWQKVDKDLGFDGMTNGSSQRATASKWNVNQHTGHMNDGRDVQFGQMPNRKGNISDQKTKTMGHAPATAGASKNPVESGKRAWTPSAGQNYKGNASMIQEKQMPNRRGNDGC